MKKVYLLFTAILLSVQVVAQNDTIPNESDLSLKNNKQYEIGIQFDDFENFGVTFKFGSSESLWRVNTLLISGKKDEKKAVDSLKETTKVSRYGLRFGREYREPIINNLEFVYGLDISFNYDFRKDSKDDKTNNLLRVDKDITYNTGISLVLGVNYLITDHISIGVELLPRFTYHFGTTEIIFYHGSQINKDVKYDNSGFNYGLNNRYGLITLSLRF
mgnify:CR=1 FL=1